MFEKHDCPILRPNWACDRLASPFHVYTLDGYCPETASHSLRYGSLLSPSVIPIMILMMCACVCTATSFDECSSNSSDDAAVDGSTLDESQVDAILEAADDDINPSPARSRPLQHANGGNGRESAADRDLGNGWKKYYIDPASAARPGQREAAAAAFERGSSQRVTLPLAAGAGGIALKRCDQSALQRAQPGRRSSRDGDRVTTFGARRDAEVGAECRTPTVGFALPVSLAARPQPASLLGRTTAGGASGLLTASSRRAAAHSADAQRGERLSNYHRGTMPRPGSAGPAAGNDTESMDDDVEKVDGRSSPGHDRSSSSGSPDDDEPTGLTGSQSSLTDWTSPSATIVQDGGQGPAQPSFYRPTGAAGFHDYVNVSHLLAARGARPDSGGVSAGSPWVCGGGTELGRMAMSETDSVENLAWPSYGTGPLHRSDSLRSATSAGGNGRSTSSLPRYGSTAAAAVAAAQAWREEGAGAGPCLATFRLATHAPFAGGHPSAAATAATSTSAIFAHKSRLAASKDDNCT